MKSKIAILACFAVAALMVLPTVSAGSMDIEVLTDDTDYSIGETVYITVAWEITSPLDFDHDKCHVTITITGPSTNLEFNAEYDATTSQQTGDFPVYCSDLYGYADHEWDTSGRSAGRYTVNAEVWAYDDSQSPPNNVIYGTDNTAITLS